MSPREVEDFWENNKQKIIDFCKENSPNRWTSIERWMARDNIRDFRPPRDKLLFQIINLMELQKVDPELYQIRIAQIRAEDVEFKYVREFNVAQRRGEPDAATLARQQLKEHAAQTVKLRFQERQLRLSRLQKRLDEEKSRLASDMGNPALLVENHVEEVLENPGGPPRFRGGPGTSPGRPPPATQAPVSTEPQ